MNDASTAPDAAAFLAGRRVVFVHGALGDVASRLGLAVLDPAMAWFAARGARCEVPHLPTGRPVRENAAALREALLAGPGGALLVAHSKGGVEALAALCALDEPGRVCAGLLAFRVPFAGSPLADAGAASLLVRVAARGVCRLGGAGSGEGLRDLTVAARAAWMRDHAAEVARVLAQVPVVAVASVARRPHPLVPFRGWLERRAGPNDGLVPLSSALLPGARHVVGEARHMASIRIEGRDGPEAGLGAALEALLR